MGAAVAVTGGLPAGQTGFLPQLRKGPRTGRTPASRTLGTIAATVAVRLHGASGSRVGSETLMTIPAGGLLQATDVFATSGAGDQQIAFATLEVRTPGVRVWAYASVIDNATGDPTIVPMTLP